jgi:hypothetical protein
MPKSPRLNDLQLILLAHAAKQDGGSVFPLPDAALSDPLRTEVELKSLLRRELVTQAPVPDAAATWRVDGDQSIGLIMTAKGAAAIGMELATELGEPDAGLLDEEEAVTSPRPSKQAEVVMLMRRADGATIDEMMAATGWLAHSTRAVLTGLRKKGHAIERGKRGTATCYRISEAA